MLYMLRLDISLVSEAGIFWWTPSVPICGGPPQVRCVWLEFGLLSSLPPLIGAGGGLVCESGGNAELLSAHFDGKQSRNHVDLLCTCHPFPILLSGQLQTNFLNTYTVQGIWASPLCRFVFCGMERRGVLPTTQFAYRKVLDTCDALLCVARNTIHSEWFLEGAVG